MTDQSEKSPAWLTEGLKRKAEGNSGSIPRSRVTIDFWDAKSWDDDNFNVVVCVDDKVVGKPLSQEDACVVHNWLQDGLEDIEQQVIDEVNRIDAEEAEEELSKE